MHKLGMGLLVCGAAFCVPGFAQRQNVLSPQERAEGFELLFDGTLEGFRSHWVTYRQGDSTNLDTHEKWELDTGMQAIVNTLNGPDLRSARKYRDFDLRLDYRNSRSQGVFYRTLLTTTPASRTGVEAQIENNPNISPKLRAGAAYDLFPPSVDNYSVFSTGRWNSLRIVAIGDSVEHWMNGIKILGFRYHNARWWEAYENSKWVGYDTFCMKQPGNRKGGYIEEGYLGLQGVHSGIWNLRNIRINSRNPRFGPEPAVAPIRPPPARTRPTRAAWPHALFIAPIGGNTPVTADGKRWHGRLRVPAEAD